MNTSIFESSINRVLSHAKDKDIAMITAFRTDPSFGLSLADNRKRNKRLEADLIDLGYRGFVKVVGYWNETPDDKNSEASKEETYLVLNVGNSSFDYFVSDMTNLQRKYKQQGIVIWKHEEQKAYLTNEQGKISKSDSFSSIKVDSLSKAWTKIKNHNMVFSECYVGEGFSDRYNQGGNFMTAMMYESKRNSLRNKILEFPDR